MISKKDKIEEMRKHFEQEISLTTGRLRGYIRISSKMDGQNADRQKFLYKNFVKQYPHFEDKTTYLEIATSKGGYTRKKWEDMVSDAKAHKFDVLFVDQVSRMGRNMKEVIFAIDEILDEGVRIYIDQWKKVYNPHNFNDRCILYFQLIQAEMTNDLNSRQTKLSTKAKNQKLENWANENNLIGMKPNNPTMFDMWIDDPFFVKKEKSSKLGVCVVEIPQMKEMFVGYMLTKAYSWRGLAELFRIPVNHKCKYGCYNGKPMPFGLKPRNKGNRDKKWERVTRKEVADFISKGGWNNLRHFDKDIDEEAFKIYRKDGTIGTRPKRKCGCGNMPSEGTIGKWKKILGYDEGIVDMDNPDAFKRIDCESHEVSIDELDALIGTGKVRSA